MASLKGTCYKAMSESAVSSRRGTCDVPSVISVKKICRRVKSAWSNSARVEEALQNLGTRH